jgi:hypothetical protein
MAISQQISGPHSKVIVDVTAVIKVKMNDQIALLFCRAV